LFSFVTIHASDGRTDRRTDGRTDGQNSDSNTVQYGKNWKGWVRPV